MSPTTSSVAQAVRIAEPQALQAPPELQVLTEVPLVLQVLPVSVVPAGWQGCPRALLQRASRRHPAGQRDRAGVRSV